MSLKAVLTVGWRDEVDAPGSAPRLFAAAATAENSRDALAQALERDSPRLVRGLDRLFRLRVGGFGPLKSMAAALLGYADGQSEDVYCHVDAFAYAFLRAAKNFDLLVPEEPAPPPEFEPESPFRRALPGWTAHLERLAEFERVGREIADDERRDYLALRRIVVRSSALDERRILMVLVVSGPSTVDDVSRDLGLPYSLGDRIFGALQEAGALDRSGDLFRIAEDALPTVLFCLHATMGMDYLAILGRG